MRLGFLLVWGVHGRLRAARGGNPDLLAAAAEEVHAEAQTVSQRAGVLADAVAADRLAQEQEKRAQDLAAGIVLSHPTFVGQNVEHSVSCGGHRAATCEECPRHIGASWCHGECAWDGTHCRMSDTVTAVASIAPLAVTTSPTPQGAPAADLPHHLAAAPAVETAAPAEPPAATATAPVAEAPTAVTTTVAPEAPAPSTTPAAAETPVAAEPGWAPTAPANTVASATAAAAATFAVPEAAAAGATEPTPPADVARPAAGGSGAGVPEATEVADSLHMAPPPGEESKNEGVRPDPRAVASERVIVGRKAEKEPDAPRVDLEAPSEQSLEVPTDSSQLLSSGSPSLDLDVDIPDGREKVTQQVFGVAPGAFGNFPAQCARVAPLHRKRCGGAVANKCSCKRLGCCWAGNDPFSSDISASSWKDVPMCFYSLPPLGEVPYQKFVGDKMDSISITFPSKNPTARLLIIDGNGVCGKTEMSKWVVSPPFAPVITGKVAEFNGIRLFKAGKYSVCLQNTPACSGDLISTCHEKEYFTQEIGSLVVADPEEEGADGGGGGGGRC
mmetsp:Transcript_43354/g.97592  ORF Transcript_43354/g.97592 Transcript_43354/m.97592 type:complete len:557 (-) Transcript_43354:60-1730(-)